MKDFYDYMDKDTNSDNKLFRQLSFILNSIDVCAKQEIADAKEKEQNTNRQKYIKWIDTHKHCFYDIIGSPERTEEFAKALYDLRCKMTHNGIAYSNKNKIYLINKDNVGRYKFGKWFIPINQLYDDIIQAINESNSTIINKIVITDKLYQQLCKKTNKDEFNKLLENIKTEMNQSRHH